MTADPRQAKLTILSLAIGAFAIGVSEFAAMGLLPYFATGLDVTEPVAGYAISGYALGVVIGAPVLAVLGARLSRKTFLTMLIGAFALANLLGAIAPDIATFTGARVLAGLPHGAYLGIAMLVAADLLPKGQRAAGVAKVMLGLTIANVVGVPTAGAIGQTFGWRWCFVIVGALALLSLTMISRFAPADAPDSDASPLRELGALRNRAVWLTLMVGAVGFGGIFAVYSYLSAAMIEAAAAPEWSIPMALSAFGVGTTIGNVVAGRLASWSRLGGAFVLLCGMVVVPVIYTMVLGSWPAMIAVVLLLGMTAGLVIPLQMRLMDVAGDAQSLAAALNHAAFNLANALGPYMAGLALAAGYGWASTGWVGAGLAAAGAAALGVAWLDTRRPGKSVPAASGSC
ncbi:MFS transporter [Tranquillimonas rosea]|uniref:MFS transporter n=1 Tax=Tranquillimonas rosea TaxID=641238 RepID=UPI003BAD7563